MPEYKFDLDYNLVKTIEEEFNPEKLEDKFKSIDYDSLESFFSKYGESLMERSLELGEQYKDRRYDVLNEAIQKTGSMKFPLLPQRFIEIAYLAIQPFKRLWISANTPKIFSYKIKECSVYENLKKLGDDTIKELPCKNLCFSLLKKAFSDYGLKIDIEMASNFNNDGECVFVVKNKER
jgi:hypothetical protein